MRVKSKKTGDEHEVTKENWDMMVKRDESSARRYIILDREDIQPKNEHIAINKLTPSTITQSIKLPLDDIAIYSSGFNTEDYSIAKWVKFFEEKNIDDYRDILKDDTREGIKKLLNG